MMVQFQNGIQLIKGQTNIMTEYIISYDDFNNYDPKVYMVKKDDCWVCTKNIKEATGYQYKEWAENAISQIEQQGIYKKWKILKVEYTIKIEVC